jgi:RimJ/RimL family protein N-acetyltransferase
MQPAAARAVVRRARDQDLGRLVELFAEVAAEGRWIGAELPVDRERRRRRFSEAMHDEQAILLVAEVDGRIVGELDMVLARFGAADLAMLVARGWRGQGLGTALLRAGIDWARGAGAHKVALQVWPHNQPAIALYEKLGFQREGVLRRHYRRRNGELWDAVVMGLQL